ncbi:glycoside hydrolase family 3 N-terminal domain-containing protein [Paractinoplanes brasiliensis]|uniref:beta-N-acetylhexosaminidase n=1 Tax=Paractinoplanes brasiliensis TaxID=52695 RepID=A0A4R6K0A3_9ACTN|nr:glycoside hydrolase family 3 N-terminal domain-containing protein [Actinoplanes brasiliensis]TDO42584.1 beta-N-acetylhexosaminidase [Actinoplanes brasiliensis]GID31311.1 beta-glucosidase [Actinoplanes brasiliensis]
MKRSLAALTVAVLLAPTACSTEESPQAGPAVASSAPTQSSAPSQSSRPARSSAPPETGGDAGDCVTRTLDGLDLQKRVGQLLMIGVAVNAPSGAGDTLRRYHVGGAFLRGRSTHTAAKLKSDVARLQRTAALPMLVAVDQEGGSVQTLKGPDFPRLPSAYRLGEGSRTALRDTTRGSARRLAGIGVNLNLAPVADTVPANVGEANPPIGAFRRQFGSDPARVAADIRTVVPASQDAGVLTTLKHFPGLGRVRVNTDTSRGATDNTATATDPYLGPFEAGIQAGTAAVMISSARYPRLDPDAIAAFSQPIITGLLRDRLGFDGLIISDDLGAARAVTGVPPAQRATRFIGAGGDMVLTIVPADAAPMAGALIAKSESDQSFRSRVDDAARRVLRTKEKAGLLRCS